MSLWNRLVVRRPTQTMERLIGVATELVYSEQFGVDELFLQLSRRVRSADAIAVYAAIEAAAMRKVGDEPDPERIVDELHQHAAALRDADGRSTVLALHRAKAELALSKAGIEFYISARAPEYSYSACVYQAEKARKGPLPEAERAEIAGLADELARAEFELARAEGREYRLDGDTVDRVIAAFANLLQHPPLIRDAALLPYPREMVVRAFEIEEDSLSDTIKTVGATRTKEGKSATEIDDELRNAREYLESVRACHVQLWLHTDIDAEDQQSVARFNRFRDAAEIPAADLEEFRELRVKYACRGIEAEVRNEPPRTRQELDEEMVGLMDAVSRIAAKKPDHQSTGSDVATDRQPPP